MTRTRWIGIIGICVIAFAIIAAMSFFHGGVSSRTTPSRMEAMVARDVRNMAIPAEARDMHDPVPSSPQNLHSGMMHFADHCATCHDNDGGGGTMIGKGLYPKPPDLRAADTQKLTDGQIFWIIENGVRFTGMPAFGGQHGSQEDSWKLVQFIRHLPQLTDDERLEMERNNPKGPEDREEEQQEEDFLNGGSTKQNPGAKHDHH